MRLLIVSEKPLRIHEADLLLLSGPIEFIEEMGVTGVIDRWFYNLNS